LISLRLVLAVFALALDFQPISDYGDTVVEATRLGPTVFPIIFAAISSRFFRNLARWKAEQRRGIGLAALEQILGSQSFAGTFERAFFLRTNLAMAVVTLMVWAMSPIGGQSSSRLLYTEMHVDSESMTLFYPNITEGDSWVSSASGLDDAEAILSTIYSASLLTSPAMKGALTDMWERPKIPKWDLSRTYQTDSDGWRDIDQQALLDGKDDYSALVGLKMQGFTTEDGVSYDVTVESSYIDFTCSLMADTVTKNDTTKIVDAKRLNVTILFDKVTPMTERQAPLTGVFEIPGNVTFFDWKDAAGTEPLTLLLAVRSWDEEKLLQAVSYFTCPATPVIVETQLSCGPNPSTICSAKRQRRLHANEPFGFVWPPNLWTVSMVNTIKSWQRASIVIDHDTASATELYFAGDTVLFLHKSVSNWTNTDMTVFSRRMTTAFNTLWQSTLDPFNATTAPLKVLLSDDPAASTAQNSPASSSTTSSVALPFDTLNQTLLGDPFRGIVPAAATKSKATEVYRANRWWIGLLIASTIILEALAVASATFEFITLAPDVLGYASSMVRDNVFVPQQQTGSALHGTERSRLLKDLRVQIADVWPDRDVGYVAFTTVGSRPRWTPLSRHRVYK